MLIERLARRFSTAVTGVVEMHHSNNSHWVINAYLKEDDSLGFRVLRELPPVTVVSSDPPWMEAEAKLEELAGVCAAILQTRRKGPRWALDADDLT